MTRGREHRDRMLEVLTTLERETDAEHRLTLTQLMERLGLDSTNVNNRRNVRNDIAALKDAGYPIEQERHKAPEYYFGRRRFTTKELKVLVDLVQSARTIPQQMSDELVASILSLGSDFEAESVASRIRVYDRVKLYNDELFDSVWAIKRAMDLRRKIQFKYFHYGFDFNRIYHPSHGASDEIVESPLQLIHKNGAHYVMTYSDVEGKEKTRRVDRMTDVRILDQKATWKPEFQCYDIDETTLFGMYSGKVRYVTLTVREDAMNVLVDQFGRKMEISNVREITEDGETVRYADIKVKVAMSPQFEGWLKGLKGMVEWKRDELDEHE